MKIWRAIVLPGLLLPLRLYLQPTGFADEVAALVPDLPRDYSLWQARRRLRDPVFRRGLGILLARALVALLWPFVIGVIVQAPGGRVDWAGGAVGVVGGGAGGGAGGGGAGGGAVSVVGGVTFGGAVSVVGGGAVVVAVVVVSTHLWLLPFQAVLSLALWLSARWQPQHAARRWRWHPVAWDEVILLPLPGLPQTLAALLRAYPAAGRRALARVAAHRFQRRAAPKARLLLARENADAAGSLPAVAALADTLTWVNETSALPAADLAALRALREAAASVAAAGLSDSPGNRVDRLAEALRTLDRLVVQPAALGRAPARIQAVIAAGLAEAQTRLKAVEPIPNPYCTGLPLEPAAPGARPVPFKGRAALFRQLEDLLRAEDGERPALLLLGQRRAGKSSVLQHLPARLSQRVVPVFCSMQSEAFGSETIAGLLHAFAETISAQARRTRGLDLPSLGVDDLRDDPYLAFGRYLDHIERRLSEHGRTLLLGIDEFEKIEEGLAAGRFDLRLLGMFRNIAQHRRAISVLFASSRQLDELPPHWASYLVQTRHIPVGALDPDDARDLVVNPVPEFPPIYAPEAVDRILALSACRPYLVQVLCRLLVERLNQRYRGAPEARITRAEVAAVLPASFDLGAAYFQSVWAEEIGGPAAQRLLAALATAPQLSCTAAQLAGVVPDDADRSAALRTLRLRELIQPVAGDGWELTIPLIGHYVRSKAREEGG